jgi:uncharacterized protein YndB with AHSA1/START domain
MSPPVIHRSFTLERTYPTSAARVWGALSDPRQKRQWFAEDAGFTIESYTLDFVIGGFERTRFRAGDGPVLTNDCLFLDVVERERVVYAYAMTVGGAPMSSSLVTVELAAARGATTLRLTEHTAYVDGNDGSISRREGTRVMLERLAHQLEQEEP